MDSTFTAEDHYRRGLAALEEDQSASALEHFRAAQRLDASSATYRSFYGLAIGLSERRLDRALALCRDAARTEFFNPVHYHNLARLHLAFGFKAEAVRFLRRGLMIDPGNDVIAREMKDLGVRRRPPLGFLRRQNALNRWFGRLRHRSRGGPEPVLGSVGG